MSNQGNFYTFIKSRPEPHLQRKDEKYYDEMQQLAYNLVRYLRMNDDPKEHSYQGNYNLTYLKENMTEDDYIFLVTKFMGHVKLGKLKEIIESDFTKSSVEYLLNEFKRDNGKFSKGLNVLEQYRKSKKGVLDTFQMAFDIKSIFK